MERFRPLEIITQEDRCGPLIQMEFRLQFHDDQDVVRLELQQLVQLLFLQISIQRLGLLYHVEDECIPRYAGGKPTKPSSTSCMDL